MTGKFITVEGTDGAGKTTQIKLLEKHLTERGYRVFLTREPGGTAIGEKIRDILLDRNNSSMNEMTEAFLYAASRIQHVKEKIQPCMEEGQIVICDRFIDSSLAYQGFGRQMGVERILAVNHLAIGAFAPDLTLYFDLKPEKGIVRKQEEKSHELDRMESEKAEFHERVYEGYQYLINHYPDRIVRIRADRTIEDVKQQVWQAVDKILQR